MPQNLKSLRFNGANYGSGGVAVAKSVSIPQTAAGTTALAPPVIQTNSATVPIGTPSWFVPTNGASNGYDITHAGADSFFVNRNRFWLTLGITMPTGVGAAFDTVYYPVPPSGVMFIPRAASQLLIMIGGNPYNTLLTAPIGGLYPVTIDQVVEQ